MTSRCAVNNMSFHGLVSPCGAHAETLLDFTATSDFMDVVCLSLLFRVCVRNVSGLCCHYCIKTKTEDSEIRDSNDQSGEEFYVG